LPGPELREVVAPVGLDYRIIRPVHPAVAIDIVTEVRAVDVAHKEAKRHVTVGQSVAVDVLRMQNDSLNIGHARSGWLSFLERRSRRLSPG
jgi:hypothetical protein